MFFFTIFIFFLVNLDMGMGLVSRPGIRFNGAFLLVEVVVILPPAHRLVCVAQHRNGRFFFFFFFLGWPPWTASRQIKSETIGDRRISHAPFGSPSVGRSRSMQMQPTSFA